MTSLEPALAYARDHRERFLDRLKELVRIPSISTLPEHKLDIERAAAWLAEPLGRLGMTRVEVCPTEGHPVVFAES
ncbi:MAG TPA: peptidase M20, partial [Candidatus Hydrogenedentes bacterium]|nr:peptidase M20 [Candidatus Hydrogenedentota bacterium]